MALDEVNHRRLISRIDGISQRISGMLITRSTSAATLDSEQDLRRSGSRRRRRRTRRRDDVEWWRGSAWVHFR